ncbi:nucleoside/nucleotide kinase family protein [Parafrigoribacterium soli]|uniref:ATP-binding protein n=1 Tax=Parafrigoribacterium soli TaxID=3144663 RepID=UPI0032F00640
MPDADPNAVPADVDALVHRIAASAARPVVLLDGRSGSGKTTLAVAIAAAYPGGVSLVRLEDIYPGWDGLEAASEQLRENVLEPLARGAEARWQRWDWTADAPAEWHPVDASRPVLIEGCGALSRSHRALASFALWVELDSQERKRRALARDGEAYRPFWDRWAAQEREFIGREHPRSLADFVVDGRTVAGA